MIKSESYRNVLLSYTQNCNFTQNFFPSGVSLCVRYRTKDLSALSELLKYTGTTDFTEIGIFLFPGDVGRGPQMLILYREKDSAIY